MPIEIKMPALSPTMEVGKLAKWLVKEGDEVQAGDILAEIETDKATMEFEAVDEGKIASIAVPEGADGVKVGTVIATLTSEDEDASVPTAPAAKTETPTPAAAPAPETKTEAPAVPKSAAPEPTQTQEGRILASPLAKRLAAEKGVDLSTVAGSGPHGRIVKADVEGAKGGTAKPANDQAMASAPAPVATAAPAAAEKSASVDMAPETRKLLDDRIPHSVEKLSGMRKTIAKRLTESMQQAPHIYLTVDIRLDKLMVLRGELNDVLKSQGVKLSVNDMLIKALGKALVAVPECNVTFAGNELIKYSRADISVAVSIPGGLITPIVQDADGRSLSSIANATKDLAERAKSGKLLPSEYQGGTASISNMGMMGIKQFTAVINPPQSTILAIGAGDQRPYVIDGALGVATVMSATGSFDHRAVDGADGARLMAAFKNFVEKPLGMLAEVASTPISEPVIRVTAMPADANSYGDIFGGWLMGLMDMGAGLIAACCAHGRAVTVAMDGMQFHAPVKVGDEVSVYGELVKVGRTSIVINVAAWRRHRHEEERIKVTEAVFTFVAIDEAGNPRPVKQEN